MVVKYNGGRTYTPQQKLRQIGRGPVVRKPVTRKPAAKKPIVKKPVTGTFPKLIQRRAATEATWRRLNLR